MPDGPAHSPGFLLWHVTLRWQRDVTACLLPLDLTHVQFVLLAGVWWLDTQGQQPNQLELAQHTGVDVKMTSQVLRRLEVKGLLTRVIDAADTRMKRLRITDSGAVLAAESVDIVERTDTAFFQAVPDSAGLLKALRSLAKLP